MKQKIYISSTFLDLKEYRSLVKALFDNQLANAFELCKIMERMWDDGSQTPFVDECVREVKASDIYILILGNKVGSYPPGESRTYTEIELDTALTAQKKIFCFHYKDFDEDEIDNRQKHAELLAKFAGKPTHTFSNPTELKADLYECLLPHIGGGKVKETAKRISLKGPGSIGTFLGRENEISQIKQELRDGGKLMLISAEGGIGKTTLAAKYWHETIHEYKHNAWLFCEGGIIQSIMEMAPDLNIDLTQYSSESSKLAAIQRALRAIERDFLLILDNANDPDDIQNFVDKFKGWSWHVLITSRCADLLRGGNELLIEHLPPSLAMALFKQYYNEEDNPSFEKDLQHVLKAINYHTLLIEIFSKNLKKSSRNGFFLRELLTHLESKELYLDNDSFYIKSEYLQKLNKVKATTDQILDALYDFSKLTDVERIILVNFALLPSQSYSDIYLKEIMIGEDKSIGKKYLNSLEDLFQKGWISGKINENYKISPVIQALIIERNKETIASDGYDLVVNLNLKLENNGMEFEKDLGDVVNYIGFYENFQKYLNPTTPEVAYYIYCCLLFFRITCNYINYKRCIDLYLTQSIKLIELYPKALDFSNNVGIAYEQLGTYYEIMGDIENSLCHFKKYVDNTRELSHKNPQNYDFKYNFAISISRLAKHYLHNNNIIKAEENYIIYFKIIENLAKLEPQNVKYQHSLAFAYSNLGKLAEEKDQLKSAFDCYVLQLNILNKLSTQEPTKIYYLIGKSTALQDIGSIFYSSELYQQAIIYFTEYNVISKNLVNNNQLQPDLLKGLATSHINLAQAYFCMDQKQIAFEHLLEAYENYKNLNEITLWKSADYRYNFSGVCKLLFSEYCKMKGTNLSLESASTDKYCIDMLENKGFTYEKIQELKVIGDDIYKQLEKIEQINPYLTQNNNHHASKIS